MVTFFSTYNAHWAIKYIYILIFTNLEVDLAAKGKISRSNKNDEGPVCQNIA